MIQRIHQIYAAALFFLLFNSCLLHPAMSQAIIGARDLAMGSTSVAHHGSKWALFSNPALADSEVSTLSVYAMQFSGFSELTDMAGAFTMPLKFGVVSAGIHRFGFDLFSENRFLIGFKKNYNRLHYGIVLNYHSVSFGREYPSVSAIGIHVGVAAEIIDGVMLGARATNINQPSFRGSDEILPRDLSVGFSYRLNRTLVLTSDIVKDVQFPVSVRFGAEAEIFQEFYGRAGFTTEPVTYSAGFGYSPSEWSVNVAVQHHELLGMSPAVDLSIRF